MATTPASTTETRKILVVDDITAARRIVTRMLSGKGFKDVKEASSVSEGLQIATKEEFDLIVVDVHLKDGTAIDLIQKIRTEKGDNAPGFLVITSDLDLETFADVSKHGITSYLLKPFNASMFSDTLEECWKSQVK